MRPIENFKRILDCAWEAEYSPAPKLGVRKLALLEETWRFLSVRRCVANSRLQSTGNPYPVR